MLIAFPIALYTATVAALLAYLGTTDLFYYRAAMVANIVGVGSAIVAAIPGTIDLFSLPRGSSARVAAVKHGSFALLATGLFSVSAALMWRAWNDRTVADGGYLLDATIPLAIAIVGILTLVIVGTLGWSLVQTHHIGVKTTDISAPPRNEFQDLATEAFRPPAGPEIHRYRH